MPRGGKRPNSGPKRKLIPQSDVPQVPASKTESQLLLEALDRPAQANDSYKVQQWRQLTEAQDLTVRERSRWKLFEHAHNRAMSTVNHLHDKPIEMNINLTLGERMKKAMAEGDERVNQRPKVVLPVTHARL